MTSRDRREVVPPTLFFVENSATPLATLDLSGWQAAVDDSALHLVGDRCGTTLTALNLDDCHSWTRDGFVVLTRFCPNLRVLSAARCLGMDEKCMEMLGTGCGRLTHLCVDGCVNVTSRAVERLAANCRNLRVVSMEGCASLGPGGIAAIASAARQLRGLRLRDVPKVNIGVAEVRRVLCVTAVCREGET